MFFMYSDDRGESWPGRYFVELDERNIQVCPGRIYGWVNHPPQVMPNGEVFFSFSSERARHPEYCKGYDWRLNTAEVNWVHCCNILTEQDPLKLRFELYSKGGYGSPVRALAGGPAFCRMRGGYPQRNLARSPRR